MISEERINKFNSIIDLIRQDSQKGSEQFYNEYGKMIWSLAYSICKCHYKADSVVNRVLAKIWQISHRINKIKNPDGWIFTIAKNFAKSENKGRYHLELKEGVLQAEDCFKRIHDNDAFFRRISPLEQEEQEIIILRFMASYSFQEIADMFSKPLPSVTSTFYRAIIKLRKKYQQ